MPGPSIFDRLSHHWERIRSLRLRTYLSLTSGRAQSSRIISVRLRLGVVISSRVRRMTFAGRSFVCRLMMTTGLRGGSRGKSPFGQNYLSVAYCGSVQFCPESTIRSGAGLRLWEIAFDYSTCSPFLGEAPVRRSSGGDLEPRKSLTRPLGVRRSRLVA